MSVAYQNKRERDVKRKFDKLLEDKDGIAPRLNELIKWTRWGVIFLGAIAAMISLFFIRDAWTVIVNLFG